jgi:hypothetical protein
MPAAPGGGSGKTQLESGLSIVPGYCPDYRTIDRRRTGPLRPLDRGQRCRTPFRSG